MAQERILVIDDEKSIRDVLTIHLTKAGYTVTSVATGKEGIETGIGEEFDLVLCDLKLTDMSGFDIIREIRSVKETLPILAVSGFIDDRAIGEVTAIPNVDYLSKPFLKSELLEKVGEILGLNQQ